jgi:GNAT superfamily N-acetyltransferase
MIYVKQIHSIDECPDIVNLFDAYRVFYQQHTDIDAAHKFIEERMKNKESLIFIAINNEKVVGFTQLYPSYSSVSMKPLYILNDLYVINAMRGHGVGTALLEAAESYGRSLQWKGMILETAQDNPAQKLYERMGWAEDATYKHYGKYF